MDKVKLVKKGEVKLQDLVEAVKSSEGFSECGAIVAFNGVVRGVGHDGSKVLKLCYEAYEEAALQSLKAIRQKILTGNPEVKELVIYHVIDELESGEDTVFIVAAGMHRKETFKAVLEALEMVKTEAAIWKKEVTVKGEAWITS
ncbi:MAG: molybdenum cofactor biosynthesis protein MoaE [Thermoprotei archaeon]|nr:MAG: molybdenum cofactor biosynthesis protein MoaE [Thermoprotei archaeon]RLF13590.1 MAG: molybdenum cofactor biosynthesis protein MoaE [Thermoprotei archaeon]